MCISIFMLCLFLNIAYSDKNLNKVGFTYDGYFKMGDQELKHSNLTAKVIHADSGLSEAWQVFYNLPLQFKNSNTSPSIFSFSTTFIFAIVATNPEFHGHGLAFAISPTIGIPQAQPNQYLGLFNATNDGKSYNHIVAIELDTDEDFQFHDIDDNHLGIDINGLASVNSSSAGYYADHGPLRKLELTSREPMQVWIDYDSKDQKLSVTIHPINIPKPEIPLLTLMTRDLSSNFSEFMYVGFSSSSGSYSSHYILGWSFQMNGQAQEINLSRLPHIPGILNPNESDGGGKGYEKVLIVISPLVGGVVFLLILIYGAIMISRRRKFIQVLEDWQILYGPHRFTYKDLFLATKGFRDGQLLGRGGFGRVYRGTLPFSNVQIAVKRISHDSRQGMKEFIAEIATIGRLRHPNLVRLLGYCRRKNELLLIYDYMPNGSLDKFLYRMPNSILSWKQRFKIIKDVASGLLYLHQQWVQVIVHRDIKPANVLIDNDMNARLGDFGLAKLWDHGNDPQTSRVVGTPGYIDPEIVHSGKSSTFTDIYSFGVFLLEVACGRRPIETQTSPEKVLLLEWVMVCLDKGDMCEAVDSRLGDEYVVEEAELVLKLGLLCSHPVASARPTISTIVQIFDGDSQLPDNLSDLMKFRKVGGWSGQGCASSYSTIPTGQTSIASITFTEPFASHGR
ncbi:L-type lectin-domain containing receptor kinase V.9-like [Prosopis cineraria]|uniref:L-type lectin-domain containing receptor kinase V.9-like n=1 Tax=Prosopis cineraria TaxID=364024 RepID=UPI00240F65ED|nr:L-type lectin-domain containing receptor kinase V.9-like [Prosopis cineraria]